MLSFEEWYCQRVIESRYLVSAIKQIRERHLLDCLEDLEYRESTNCSLGATQVLTMIFAYNRLVKSLAEIASN